ncbi:MAG TPA: TonB-dependent receptor, partial [Prolixibacteraceae bacterium]|nr:TonB-dependent receptor [Prolixibacteraceae bacterium]
MKPLYLSIAFYFITGLGSMATAQNKKTDSNIFGDVQSNGEHIPFAGIFLDGTSIGTTTDATGHYLLTNLPVGEHMLTAKALGYKTAKKSINILKGQSQEINFVLEEEFMHLNQVVVTGTKTFKRQTESPVIVNVLGVEALNLVQACNISEGLRFQPGLRVETDCQTCNYTQLRMNGLGGSYSQILINGRPIFSPLTGLYGMEQIPANMVERIEVVRGGGSALYGSSAIGGTVNIITQIPKESTYEFSALTQSTNAQAMDNIMNGNLTMLTSKRTAGAAVF